MPPRRRTLTSGRNEAEVDVQGTISWTKRQDSHPRCRGARAYLSHVPGGPTALDSVARGRASGWHADSCDVSHFWETSWLFAASKNGGAIALGANS